MKTIGILNRIFRRKEPQETERFEVMGGSPAIFNGFSGNAYESDIYRSSVDAIARNVAKLNGTHVVTAGDQRNNGDQNINKLLQTRPNKFMTAYDLLYKMITHYYLNNNAFAYLDKDEKGNLKGIYPLPSSNMEFVTDSTGELFCKFNFNSGKTSIFRYADVIHIRRHYNSNDLLGDTNTAIEGALNLAHTQSEGLEQGIKAGATIRGMIKHTGIMSQHNLTVARDDFIRDYLQISNTGGVVALDQKFDYIPMDNKPATIDDKQLDSIKKKIYEYLGISENIVNSSYSEDEYSAFYESIIEPLAIQLSLEFTDKTFTSIEQTFGNKITFETNRLQFSNNTTKTRMLQQLIPMGILTVNESREMLNLPTVEGGHKRFQTLNVVNSELVDSYQMTSKVEKVGEEVEGNKNSSNSE